MKRLLVAWLLAPAIASADVSGSCSRHACGREAAGEFGAYAHMRVGSAKAPFVLPGLGRAESEFTQARIVVLGLSWPVGRWRLDARVPSSPSLVRQPAGSYVDDKAMGNPELGAETVLVRYQHDAVSGELRTRIGVGLPLAFSGGSASLARNRALAIGDALDGWRNPELYAPGVLPVTATLSAAGARGPAFATVECKLPLLVRIHDAELPEDVATRPLGIVPSVVTRVGIWPRRWFAAELGAQVAFLVLAPAAIAESSDRQGTTAFGLEPRLTFAVAQRSALVLDAQLALAGPLRETYGIGLSYAYLR